MDLRREIEMESELRDLKDIVKKLPIMFKRIKKKIEIERLADLLDINSKSLTNFILFQGDELQKEGLSLQIDGDFVIKI